MTPIAMLRTGDVVKGRNYLAIVVGHSAGGVRVCRIHRDDKPHYRCDLPLGWIMALQIGAGSDDRIHCVPKNWLGTEFERVGNLPQSMLEQTLASMRSECAIREFEDRETRRNNRKLFDIYA